VPAIKRSVRFGDPRLPPRFWNKVHASKSGCWLWTAYIHPEGYGQYNPTRERPVMAHRVSYLALVGPINAQTIDHLCRVRHCVNPRHLEPVSMRENNLRGISPMARNARKLACVNGHPFNEANTYFHVNPRGWTERHCRVCNNDRCRVRRRKVGNIPPSRWRKP